ncbi:hypothetical protein COF68_03040 [Bacillus toyonensis]|nr:hypothetical protein CON60_22985 [Bacillus toyonensis]PED61900.1 hypothetical protein CON89_07205 [Bacillus toyonensis]PEK01729.1 hypothetical protein CN687_07480 [Bacillus toyonensis]PEL10154.1 hypothetical protein CN614_07760 [Bacillus toyonensis]PEN35505.1 hypothetical protein CN541_20525 [Bacillus toyonensis]
MVVEEVFISSIIYVFNNGMGELMIAIFLGVIAIANGLLLLALKVVRVIVAKGKWRIEFDALLFIPLFARKSLHFIYASF